MADHFHKLLTETFGLDEFRPGQREVIEAMARRENLLAVMPTGGGKSLCYQLPALAAVGLTVVVSPLIALMIDQIRSLRARKISVGGFYSGMSSAERSDTYRALEEKLLKILYVSPERFTYESFLDRLVENTVSHFIIDEAHCVSQWGHDFRSEYLALRGVIKSLGSPPVGAFTATATQEVRRDIEVQLGIEGATYFFTGFDRENLELEVRPAPTKSAKLSEIVGLLKSFEGPAIVYCSTRKNTQEVAADLKSLGFSAVRYHAGLPDKERAASQKAFLSDRARIIVATCAFGMGIDKPDIRLIIHHGITSSVEAYYQEIGRAGRDGAPARCVLLWNFPDVQIRRYLIEKSETGVKSAAVRGAEERRLEKMIQYAGSRQCRRSFIIDYFAGRHVVFRCGVCDICRGLVALPAVTPTSNLQLTFAEAVTEGSPEALEWARMTLSCIERIRRAGVKPDLRNVAAVLRGSRTGDVKEHRLDSLSTWDLLTGWKSREVRSLFRALRSLRLMALRKGGLVLTELGGAVMTGKVKIAVPFARDEVTGGVIIEKSELEPEGAYDKNVFEKLRAWRGKRARSIGMPPYVIAHDRTLKSIAMAAPRDVESLVEVKGMGPIKVEKYGEEILGVLREADVTSRAEGS